MTILIMIIVNIIDAIITITTTIIIAITIIWD
jgi:hypothetical protein